MSAWFCLECSAPVDAGATVCPSCGRPLDPPDRTYERKLILALGHRLSDRRILAAKILGQMGSEAAVPRLTELARDRSDPYLQAEAARALAAIDPDQPEVRRLASHGPLLAREAARGGKRSP